MYNLNIKTISHETCKFKFLKLNQIEISHKWENCKGPQMGYKVIY